MSNCYRCDAAIIPGQASRRKEEVRQIVSSNGNQKTHYGSKLICSGCAHSEKVAKAKIMALKAVLVILGAFVVFGLLEIIDPFSLLSSEARSQETAAVMAVTPKISTKPGLIPPENDDGPTIFYRWMNR
jgi:hypothetical protein